MYHSDLSNCLPYYCIRLKVVRQLTLYSAKVRSHSDDDAATGVEDDEEEGEDPYNYDFSLAYGAKILLNAATLRLKRGHCYSLCGRDGTGKSTQMRDIHNGRAFMNPVGFKVVHQMNPECALAIPVRPLGGTCFGGGDNPSQVPRWFEE